VKTLSTLLTLLVSYVGLAQNPAGFNEMCDTYVKGTIQTATSTQLKFELDRDSSIIILDTREKKEYGISHIPNSINVGYNDFSIDTISFPDKNSKIYVYCSIGYRSEKIGEKLELAGYQWVINLRGGIFDWANNGYLLIDGIGDSTTIIHGYDSTWGAWINDSTCTVVIE
jgi:rhodanese-related sulfurtransferase